VVIYLIFLLVLSDFTESTWYKSNDNKVSIQQSKHSKLGNKEDTFPKIKKKSTSTTYLSNNNKVVTNIAKKLDQIHINEMKCWIYTRLGNKSYYKQQQYQKNTERILREQHSIDYQNRIQLEISKCKEKFKKFHNQIYNLAAFKKFYKITAHNNTLNNLFNKRQQQNQSQQIIIIHW
jgi:hypothetical protein